MVNDNETVNQDGNPSPKRRGRLFGSRKKSADVAADASPGDAPEEAQATRAADAATSDAPASAAPAGDAPAVAAERPRTTRRPAAKKATDHVSAGDNAEQPDATADSTSKKAAGTSKSGASRRNTARAGSATTEPDTAKPDTEKTDSGKTDTAKTDSAKPDTEKPDTEKPDTEKTDSGKTDTAKTDSAKASKGDAGDDKAGSDKETAKRAPAKKSGSSGSRAKKPVDGSDSVPADAAKASESSSTPDRPTTSLLFQAPAIQPLPAREPRSGRKDDDAQEGGSVRRRTRRRPGEEPKAGDDAPGTVVRVRQPRPKQEPSNEPTRVKGSTRLEAKKQRRRDGRDAGRRRPVVTESEFLARRESVDRVMVVRSKFGRIQIAVLEDGVLVEHYVAKAQDASLIGNVYLGRVQNVLPSMEAAFVDIGRGRNAVLYSGEVDWEAAAENSTEGKSQARRIELALKAGDRVLVQVTKDPIGHKGARLTSQVSLPGRYLVYVPNGSMSGISRKLPDTERARLKKILKEVLPENVGVIVRTAAEGATEEQLTLDVQRLTNQWAEISRQVETVQAPALLHSEPDLLIKIVRDVFNEDFQKLVIEGQDARQTIESYVTSVAPDLLDRLQSYEGSADSFDEYRVSEQIEKALDRKVWLPSGGSLVIDRTEAMTVVDVNTGKFVGSGGNLEETVTKNNLEAAEEIVRQLRLRDIGGIIVVDFIDMVLESNRDLVLRRLVECLSRDRTKHQVAEVTSLGLVQMTRKKLGLGLLETFSEPCDVCAGRGIVIHHDPVSKHRSSGNQSDSGSSRRGRGKGNGSGNNASQSATKTANGNGTHAITDDVRNALAQIAASTVIHTVEDEAEQSEPKSDSTKSEPKTAESKIAEPEDAQPKDADRKAEQAPTPAVEEAVAILDIPVTKSARAARKISSEDAEQILGSVLEALPEPKQPGQGRSRVSRRAGSAGKVVSAPANDKD